MTRSIRLYALLALAGLATPAAVRAATIDVQVGGGSFTFTPQTVTIQAGDTVRWTNAGGFHNVASDDGVSFRSGPPSTAHWVYQQTFAAGGTFGYNCEPHVELGMVGTVIVLPAGARRRPAAPTGLTATGLSTTEIRLDWTDASVGETEFRIEQRTVGEPWEQIATVPAGSTSLVVGGLDPESAYLFRVRAANARGASAPSAEAVGATLAVAGTCAAGPHTLCLNGGRFRVEVDWATATRTGQAVAVPVPTAPDSGLFYFFLSTNLEMLIKVLDACIANDRFWVFYAATTNVEFVVRVTDTETGQVRPYFNPLDRPAPPVQDTDAFATCP